MPYLLLSTDPQPHLATECIVFCDETAFGVLDEKLDTRRYSPPADVDTLFKRMFKWTRINRCIGARNVPKHVIEAPPHDIITLMEQIGYRVVCSATNKETFVWTMHREEHVGTPRGTPRGSQRISPFRTVTAPPRISPRSAGWQPSPRRVSPLPDHLRGGACAIPILDREDSFATLVREREPLGLHVAAVRGLGAGDHDNVGYVNTSFELTDMEKRTGRLPN